MKIRTPLLIAVSTIALAASPALGGHDKDGEKMDPAEKFAAIDADGNGGLSLAEVTAHVEKKHEGKDEEVDKAKLEEKFGKMDADGNGEISMDEWKAAHEKKKEEKEEDDGGE